MIRVIFFSSPILLQDEANKKERVEIAAREKAEKAKNTHVPKLTSHETELLNGVVTDLTDDPHAINGP